MRDSAFYYPLNSLKDTLLSFRLRFFAFGNADSQKAITCKREEKKYIKRVVKSARTVKDVWKHL